MAIVSKPHDAAEPSPCPSPGLPGEGTTHRKPRPRYQYGAYLFILPNFVGFALFTLGPVLAAFAIAFCDWKITRAPRFVGLQNFADLMGDSRFWKYTFNTLFLMLGIPVSTMGSLVLAAMLHQRVRGAVVFRTMYYLPTVTAGIAILILWKGLLDPDVGLINKILSSIGIPGPGWLIHPTWAKPAIMLVGFWISVGGTNMVLYLAALSNINPELYEVARLDGAGAWQRFTNITWPMVSPTTFFITIMSIIGGFQGGFEAVYIMTGGGPAGSTEVLSYYVWEKGFVTYQMGYAAAIALVIFAMVLVLTILSWRFGGRVVHY